MSTQLEERAATFLRPAPATLAPGHALIVFPEGTMVYGAGEQRAVPDEDAIRFVRAGIAEVVDPVEASRLNLANLPKFDGPVRLKILRDAPVAYGVTAMKGTVDVYDPRTATRLVRMSFAEVVR